MSNPEKLLKNNWTITKFANCIVQINTGLNPRKNFSLGTGTVRYITAKNLTESGQIDFTNCDYVTQESKGIINKRSQIKIGDILLSSRAPIGNCHLIKDDPKDYDIGESIFSIRANADVILPEYLCLYMRSKYFKKIAEKRTAGSIILEIRISDLLDIDVIVPPKDIQHNIAQCINALDEKIEINNRINDNLSLYGDLPIH